MKSYYTCIRIFLSLFISSSVIVLGVIISVILQVYHCRYHISCILLSNKYKFCMAALPVRGVLSGPAEEYSRNLLSYCGSHGHSSDMASVFGFQSLSCAD